MAQIVDWNVVNKEINEEARQLRENIPMRKDPGDLTEFIRSWSEDDVLENRPCKALVVILKTRGCTWAIAGGCTMCGYANESAWTKVGTDELVAQFARAWKRYDGEEIVKIYTSGSFLDRFEVPVEAQQQILEMIGDRPKKVAFEARPDYIHEDSFKPLQGLVNKLEVGIGVESSNFRVLRDSVNKGHGFDHFETAAKICRDHDVSVKAYLMCKPPYLTEGDALRDSTQTMKDVGMHADVASLNPTNVQGNTVASVLFNQGRYRTPWLWTLVQSLLDARTELDEKGFQGILKSDVIAAGQSRGAHNCGQCDERVVKYIQKYKETQNKKWLQECMTRVQCSCRARWSFECSLPMVC